MTTETKKLYRLPKEGKIAGVAAGVADYFAMDATLVRVIFVFAAFLTEGFAIIAYIIAIFLLPTPETDREATLLATESKKPFVEPEKDSSQFSTFAGVGLIVLGLWMLAHMLLPDVFENSWRIVWPIVIVALGLWIVKGSKK